MNTLGQLRYTDRYGSEWTNGIALIALHGTRSSPSCAANGRPLLVSLAGEVNDFRIRPAKGALP
jgi:hypothetical protein